MAISRSSRNILNRFTAEHFTGESLHDRIGRAVCEAECLPRKEFYEAWEAARRIRRSLRGGPIIEPAAGHGLLSMLLILLDDTSPTATCVDLERPASHAKTLAALERHWPRLQGRVHYDIGGIEAAQATPASLVVSVHACGALTDRVLDLAIAAHSRVAVLPCCHDLSTCDTGGLAGWLDGPLAVDVTRAARLRHAGYEVRTQAIPPDITPKNRLLIAWPRA